jgi:hypothetical protein
MSFAAPKWLTKHGAELGKDPTRQSWFVFFGDQPEYRLDLQPVGGKFACEVVQSNNGSHVALGEIADSEEGALRNGLEALRKVLGW